MPQKRNPYALTMVRGEAGILIGRLTGMLAVTKTPSARSDNLIFAYGEVPRALQLAGKATRLMAGVVGGLTVHGAAMYAALESGFAQAADLAEYVMTTCGLDYRSAYEVVGEAVRRAAAAGLRGVDLTGEMLDEAAAARTGSPIGLTGRDLHEVLDPRAVVRSRVTRGGAAPEVVRAMAKDCGDAAAACREAARRRGRSFDDAEAALVRTAEDLAAG
jgi:argininosuccinate lyase